MKKNLSTVYCLPSTSSGFSVLEVVLAAALFVIISSGLVGITLQSLENNRLAEEQTIASQFASEGIEAVRSIRNQSFSLLANSNGTGVSASTGIWKFSGSNNTLDKFTRVITVADAQRDTSGNFVNSGGIGDATLKKIVSTVTWAVTPGRNNSVISTDYLSNFRRPLMSGMLVYGNGGTTTDAMQYQTFDGTTWSTAASMADVDGGSTNRALRAIKVYSSPTRTEKVAISHHYDGTVQYIYGQVYNGTSWGNVQLLSSWTASTFLNVRAFDGTYLNNGNFMVVFSDNTNVPEMRTWNGTSWSAQSALTSLGAAGEIPSYITIAARPGTNEVMAAFFTQALDTITQYWSGSAWSAITSHATAALNAADQNVDFAWSPNSTTIGGLVYTTANNDKGLNGRIFQADGAGSGTWGTTANAVNQAQNIRVLSIAARPNANEFQACTKDQQAAPDITCRKLTFSGTTATWTTPTNPIITAGSINDVQLTFDYRYQNLSGDPAVMVYSDNTAVPKYKKYTASTTTWDLAATSITTTGSPGTFESVTARQVPTSNDIMFAMADSNMDLFTIMWDGTNGTMFSTPAGKAYTTHGTNGSAVNEYWYDFAWSAN